MSLKSSSYILLKGKYQFTDFIYWPLIGFSLLLFFINLGDAVMSYLVPVYIEQYVSSSLVMGCIMSVSSLVGFICDIYFPKIFPGKSYSFHSWMTIANALVFTSVFILFPASPIFFVLAMIFWGIYYESLRFSHFHFIKSFVSRENYTGGWGISTSFRSAAYLIGPLIAVFVLQQGFKFSFSLALFFYIISAFGLFIFTSVFRNKSSEIQSKTQTSLLPPAQAFKIWKLLWKNIWPLYLFLFIITLVDSAFWSVGTILSEQLRKTSMAGNFLLPAYALPSLFVGMLAKKASLFSGKKRAAFVSAGIGGLLLIPAGLVISTPFLILLVLLSSVFSSLSFPEIYAVFEDYVNRLGKSGDEMIGLQSSAICLSYIVGPIVAGGLAVLVGTHATFTILGGLVAIYSFIACIYIPRKIRLPQTEIANI